MEVSPALWFLTLFGATTIIALDARIIAAVILPHGDFAIDPTLLPAGSASRSAANAIAQGAASVGNWLGHTIDPDLILVSTPHGIQLTHDFGFYLGSTASGKATIGRDLHNSSHPSYTLRLKRILLEYNLTQRIVDLAIHDELNATGILVSPDDSQDETLYWGEVIPLSLIPRRQKENPSKNFFSYRNNNMNNRRLRQHLILSHPLRRYSESATDFVPELLHLGHWLGHFLEQLPQRVAIVISGDLSHTHLESGPYGYSNASAPFDDAIGRWAQDPCRNEQELLHRARDLQQNAKSCGYNGFVVLHGMLQLNCTEWVSSSVLVNRNATYYGMMAAQFSREFPIASE